MILHAIQSKIEDIKTEALVFFLYENSNLPIELSEIDKKINSTISLILKKKYFKSEENEIHSIYTHGKIGADKMILAGLGEKKKFTIEAQRRVLAGVVKFCKKHSLQNITLVLNDKCLLEDLSIISIISGYDFHFYKSKDKGRFLKHINFYFSHIKDEKKLNTVLKKSKTIAESINWTRDIVNHPGNEITPKVLSEYAKKLNKSLAVKILGKKEIEKQKMGLLLGVAKGSAEEPQFIIIDYKPSKYKDTIVLVGKGLTFDSGGISIKPSNNMGEMKMDMAGAGTVLGIMRILPVLKPNARVVGLIPATENMPGGKALKPGDILRSMSGKTVEVENTDAEGRLILADALFYAQKYKPNAIIDLATLTGSCASTFGSHAAGILGNDQKLIDKIIKFSNETGERVWQLPLWDDYRKMIKSDVADLSNTGEKTSGTITAAAFLEEFVGNYPWVHLDIAGTAMLDKEEFYNPKGATGYGVRLMLNLLENWEN